MTRHPDLPDADERARLNAALRATGTETGWWDEHGRPAPWPEDIDHWRPETAKPIIPEPGQPPF